MNGAPEHEALRDQLRQDPDAVAAYVAWLEVQIVRLREGAGGQDGESRKVLAQNALQMLADDPGEWRIGGARPESAAIDELAWFGELAVPVVVHDLLDPRQAFLRQIGIEILVRIGEPALPSLLAQVRSGDAQQQRVVARALGALGARGAALSALEALTRSSEWTVRADAVQGLHDGDAEARDLLVRMLRDEDAFVRRKAAATLGFYREPATVRALADFLEFCQERKDIDSEVAAQNALQVIAQRRGPRTVAAWQDFADQLEQQGGAR